jgi:hypothetical protein
MMHRSPEQPVSGEVARELCQRVGGKAILGGSISELGSQYVIGVKAVNCSTSESLATGQGQAASKEAALKVLGQQAVSMRSKLGESLASMQRYDTPIEQATTPSLEALKTYSLGLKTEDSKGHKAALPFFKQAAALDPKFAMAYARMAAITLTLMKLDYQPRTPAKHTSCAITSLSGNAYISNHST